MSISDVSVDVETDATAGDEARLRSGKQLSIAGRITSSPNMEAAICAAISIPNRAVGEKLLKHKAIKPKLDISVESIMGSPECSKARLQAIADDPVSLKFCW